MPRSEAELNQGMQEVLDKINKPYGFREDGTPKGKGWMGPLKRSDGKISTELSVTVDFDGKKTLIPTIVPTLNEKEVDYLLNSSPERLRKIDPVLWNNIIDKAVNHAKKRISEHKSPFFD